MTREDFVALRNRFARWSARLVVLQAGAMLAWVRFEAAPPSSGILIAASCGFPLFEGGGHLGPAGHV